LGVPHCRSEFQGLFLYIDIFSTTACKTWLKFNQKLPSSRFPVTFSAINEFPFLLVGFACIPSLAYISRGAAVMPSVMGVMALRS